MKELSFTIEEHVGVIGTSAKGWQKELNLVRWGKYDPKFDIREWSPDHSKMGKGITLTAEELKTLRSLLGDMILL